MNANDGKSAPQTLDDKLLDAAAGGGEETVIFQYGTIPVQYRSIGGDPDRPILVGGVPNPGK